MSEPRAYMRHVRELGYCARGARDFFTRHGWAWTSFLRNGIGCADLEATGDALAIRLAQKARESK